MTRVTVVVPWRCGCPWREKALHYQMRWMSERWPDWRFVLATDNYQDGPWCKAEAVANGVREAGPGAGILVVADADVVCDGIGAAVDAVAAGAPWAVPHTSVYRLTERATAALHEAPLGAELPDVTGPHSLVRGTVVSEIHRGVQGGGITVLPRDAWPVCPMDARFRGWGQEDLAWGWALKRLLGQPYAGTHPLVHLWHPPQQRASRKVGSTASMELWKRYRARYTGAEIRELLAEDGAHPGPRL